ncbi:TonB-dependent receptor, partial [Rhizorhabdus wittichii]|uniref:TonB-dependent receptor n=1 Tax=Rhizorhabdus wittichii TaxID=160791 RepID=UPI00035C645E
LGDIVVTARRREESLQKVPVAVTAITSDMLTQRSIRSAADLANSTPGLQMQPGLEGRQAARFYIRGQGVGFGNAPPSVVTYFSEVPLDPNGGATFALNDVALVQVLRGPQGTLFGRNANGGAVVIAPKAPGQTTEGFAELSYGNYNYIDIKGGVTLPISSTLSARFSGTLTRRDGYTRNLSGKDFDNLHSSSWRVFLRWQPSDSFTDDLIYAGQRTKSNGLGTIIVAARPGTPAITAYPLPGLPLVVGTGLGNDLISQRAYGPRLINEPATYFGESSKIDLFTNTATLKLGGATIKNITGVELITACPSLPVTSTQTNFFVSTCFDNYLNVNAGLKVHPTTEQKQITNETNISGETADGRFDWIAGAFFLWSDPKGRLGTFRSTRAAKSLFVANVSSALQKDRSQAVYVQGTYEIAPGLKLTAGGRYTWDQRTLQFGQLASSANGAPGTFVCASPGLAANTPAATCVNIFRKSFSDYGYTFNLDWQAADRLLLYVSTRRGYKSGGFNSTSTSAAPLYNPELLEDVELGAKWRWGSGSVNGTLNLAYFHGWYDQIQQQLSVVVNNQATVITTNAGGANIDGVEVEANGNFGNLNVAVNYAYFSGRYNDCPANPAASKCFLDSGIDVTKSKFVSAPKNSLGVTARYTIPIGDTEAIVPQINYYTRSTTAFAADNVLNYESFAPGYQVVNARLEWQDVMGRKGLSLSGFINNLFDRDYVQSGIGLGGLIGTTSFIYGEPRTYGATLNWQF